MAALLVKDDEARWRYVQARKPSSSFVYAVKTTKIFCRPDCPARLARRANVAFFDCGVDAQQAGFRACKRCKPDQATRRVVTGASVSMSASKGAVSNTVATVRDEDDELAPGEQNARRRAAAKARRVLEASHGRKAWKHVADEVGLSPRYLFEAFKAIEGVTPGVFAERLRRTRSEVAKVESVDSPTTKSNEIDGFPQDNTWGGTAGSGVVGNGSIDWLDNNVHWDDFTSEDFDAYVASLGLDAHSDLHISSDPLAWTPTETNLDSIQSSTTANTPAQDSLPEANLSVDPFAWPLEGLPFDKFDESPAVQLFNGDWTGDLHSLTSWN